jgi:hypothetical protein
MTMSAYGIGANRAIGRLNLVAAFDCVLEQQPVSRAELHRVLRLSKPTISRVIDELEMLALVRPVQDDVARPSPRPGRNGVLYEVVPGLPRTLGIDVEPVGSAGVRIRAARADIRGRVLASAEARLANGSSAEIVRAIGEAQRRLGDRVEHVVVGLQRPDDAITAALRAELGERLHVDSRVHLAALAHGERSGAPSFLFVSLREQSEELALVLDGDLRRGGRPADDVVPADDPVSRVVALAVPVIRATDVDLVVLADGGAGDPATRMTEVARRLADEVEIAPRVIAGTADPLTGAITLGVRSAVQRIRDRLLIGAGA